MTDRVKTKEREGAAENERPGERQQKDGGEEEEGSRLFLNIITRQDGRSPTPSAFSSSLLYAPSIQRSICVWPKKIADTASSKLRIGSLGQVGLLTSEGSESRGGEEKSKAERETTEIPAVIPRAVIHWV